MAHHGTDLETPVGRIVWGNPATSQWVTDNNNKQVFHDDGTPKQQWAFGLAIPKAEFGPLYQGLMAEVSTLFPPREQNGPPSVPNGFSWKVLDGDGIDNKGKSYADREGYAGCMVLSISSQLDDGPKIVRYQNGAYVEHVHVKTGDYVRVAIRAKVHGGKPGQPNSKPGVYINPQMVDFIGYGKEIIRGPDANDLFKGRPAQLPPGASATPIGSGGAMPLQGQTGGQQGGMPGFGNPAGGGQTAPAQMPSDAAASQGNQTASPSDGQGDFVNAAQNGFPGMG